MRNQGFEEIYNLQEIITYKDGTGFAEGSTERNTVKRKKKLSFSFAVCISVLNVAVLKSLCVLR